MVRRLPRPNEDPAHPSEHPLAEVPTSGRRQDGGDTMRSPRDWTPRQQAGPLEKRRASASLTTKPDPEDANIPPARRLVDLGRRCDLAGRLDEAIGAYEAAIQAAQSNPGDGSILAEALRRLAVIQSRRGENETARGLCKRSYDVASTSDNPVLRAEALNTLGGLELVQENLEAAHDYLRRALELSEDLPELRGRIQQNLGIMCTIRGQHAAALAHYDGSLQAFRAAGNRQGCAIAYHNLGMVSAHQKHLEDADRYYEEGRRTAEEVGDENLRALCLMNRAEVLIALHRYDAAQASAEKALAIFETLHAPEGIATLQRLLGVIFRETGRLGQAQSRLELAIELAGETGSPITFGETLREAARLQCKLGHIATAVAYLSQACREFSRVPVVLEGPGVIEGEYPNFVRDWCELVRSVDPYTADHCDRVAHVVVAMAQLLGLDAATQATIRVAGQLHDVGVLSLPERNLAEGAALLAGAECFVRVTPIVQQVHEAAARNGEGRMDDPIALGGQMVGIAEAYDRLVHDPGTRVGRKDALADLAGHHRWHADVYDALVRVTAERPAGL
jgi:tetratricopeptide (TPR) repeat protein